MTSVTTATAARVGVKPNSIKLRIVNVMGLCSALERKRPIL